MPWFILFISVSQIHAVFLNTVNWLKQLYIQYPLAIQTIPSFQEWLESPSIPDKTYGVKGKEVTRLPAGVVAVAKTLA